MNYYTKLTDICDKNWNRSYFGQFNFSFYIARILYIHCHISNVFYKHIFLGCRLVYTYINRYTKQHLGDFSEEQT